jgi:hypothetical protein
MMLTEQQKEQVKAFLKQRVNANPVCIECQNSHIDFEPRMMALCTLIEENKQHPVEFYPVIPIVCHYCGHTRLFSAKILGLVK